LEKSSSPLIIFIFFWILSGSSAQAQPVGKPGGLKKNPVAVNKILAEADKLISAGEIEKAAILLDTLRENLMELFEYDAAIPIAYKTLSLQNRISDKKLIADAYNVLGAGYWRKGSLDSALIFLDKGLEVRRYVSDPRGLAKCHNLIGLVYWRKGDAEKSYRSYLKALALRDSLGDVNEVTLIYNNIGLIFQRLKYYDLAEEYYKKALKLADSVKYMPGRFYSLRRMIGLNIAMQRYDEALRDVDAVAKFYLSVNNQGGLAQLYNDVGVLKEKAGRKREAEEWFAKSHDLAKAINDRFIESFALLNLGRIELVLGDLPDSRENLERGEGLARQGGYHVILRDVYLELSKLHTALGDEKTANKFLKAHLDLKDSIINEQVTTSVGDMRIRYEIERSREQKESLENILEERNKANLVLLALVVFFLGSATAISFLFVRQRRLGYLLQATNGELEVINTRLQKSNEELTLANETKTKLFSIIGHDLKSPFVSILGFSELLQMETLRMKDRSLSELSEKILDSSMKLVELVNNLTAWALQQREMIKAQPMFFPVGEVASSVVKALMLNLELKDISVKSDFEKPDDVFADREMISTVLRNILSNAIKFSYAGGVIELRGSRIDDRYCIVVSDNGVGMSKDMIGNILHGSGTISTYGTANEKGTGLGLSVSRDFIKQNKGSLKIVSSPGEGSSFILEIPTS